MKLRMLFGLLVFSLLVVGLLPAAAQEPAANTVSYNGFSFTYDAALNGHITISRFAGDPVTLDQPGGPEVRHTQFTLSEADTVPSIFDSTIGIRVYNTADFAAYPNQAAQLQKLQTLLASQADLTPYMAGGNTSADGSLPFLPIIPFAQVIRARAQYVANQSVQGIRYIAAYRHDVSPLLSNQFLYTFQGITLDGQHYVSALFKLNTTLFPADVPADFNMDTFVAGFDNYLVQSIATLNGAQPDAFTPSLATLDAVVQSLTFVSAVAAPPLQAPPVSSAPNLGGLSGVNWVLVSYGPAAAPIRVQSDAPISASFASDGISGSAGCNQYSGTFQFNSNSLVFSPLIRTEKACVESVMTQENAYLAALQIANSYQIIGDQLQISYPEGVLTYKVASNSAEATPVVNTDSSLGGLAGVPWRLVSINATPALADVVVSIDFTAQGVSGSAGCNQYSGTFQYNNGSLTFSPLAASLMACAEPILTQESAYLAALQSATGYQVSGNQLQITYPNGVLVFKAGT